MQAQFSCTPAIMPVLESKLKAIGCKIDYVDTAIKMDGLIHSAIGDFRFNHDGKYLSVHTLDEGLSIQFALNHIKNVIEEHSKC